MKKIILLVFALCYAATFFGQQHKTVQDSTEVYQKIEAYSEKNRVAKTMHRWLFRPMKSQPKTSSNDLRNQADFQPHLGKHIRNITIKPNDPFGFSFTDSTVTARDWLSRTGNKLHIKSKKWAIRDFLFFDENDALDTLLISESARLLRTQRYIKEVEILPRPVPGTNDSIDLVVTTLDSWSIIPDATISASQTKLSLTEYNFVGTGHLLELGYAYRKEDGESGYGIQYSIPNFKNTFISGTARYTKEYENYYIRSLDIDRVFYSPFTRWAGGVFIEDRSIYKKLPNAAMQFSDQDVKYYAQDYWGGRSFSLFRGSSEHERTTNLVLTARAFLVDYRQTPSLEYDSDRFFSDEQLFLGSIGINSRQFVQDHYIFADGVTEDVPVGTLYAITGGWQHKNKKSRPYVGIRTSYGNYFRLGFLSVNLEADTYFNNSKAEQTTYSIQANYFSHLIDLGNDWKMRQFIKPQIIIGANRMDSPADRLSLNEYPGFSGAHGKEYDEYNPGSIRGFDSPVYGTKKYIFETQTQFYSPWTWLGFRFNPFANLTVAMITDKDDAFGKNPIYASIGVGCLIRNDFLVFNSFQFSLAYFPKIPGQGSHLFKPNAFRTDDFGFQEFQITKPKRVTFR